MSVQFRSEETEYLKVLRHFRGDDFETEYRNGSVFRNSLYTLREQLLIFVEKAFSYFISHYLYGRCILYVKSTLISKVCDSDAKICLRRCGIISHPTTNINIHWTSIAACYTGSFVEWDDRRRQEFTIEKADPTDLLKILLNCSLFNNPRLYRQYGLATTIIGIRNTNYAHSPTLLIDAATLDIFTGSKASLVKLLRKYLREECAITEHLPL